jgi:hypothetical protein
MKSLLSILALLFAVSANADVFVTAQLRGLSYTLYDLNPFDGLAPSLTWAPRDSPSWGGQTELHGETWIGNDKVDDTWEWRSPSPATTPLAVNMEVPGVYWSNAMLTGREDPATMVLEVNAQVETAPGKRIAFSRLSGDFQPFTVGPSTGVIFTMLMSAMGYSDQRYGYEHVGAHGNLQIKVPGVGWEEEDWQNYDQWGGSGTAPRIDDIALLDVSYMNRTGGAQDGYLMMHLLAGGDADAAMPIPEPESYAMLLAGLAIVGGAVWHRRRARRDDRFL